MNVPEWVVTQFAVGRIGAVLVNVNPAYRLHELKDALAMADVATLIVGTSVQGLELRGDGRVALSRGGRGDVSRLVVGPVSPSRSD